MTGPTGGTTVVGRGTGDDEATVRPPSASAAAAGERIAEAALAELPGSGVVLLDAGPLTERLAGLLPAGSGLTVFTNAVPMALGLASRGDLDVHLLGGRVHGRAGTAVSSDRFLDRLHVDVAFMTADGVSPERGLTCADPREVRARQAMVRACGRLVLLADHTRIGRDRLSRFARLAEADCLITDTGTDPDDLRRLRGRGPRVLAV